VAVLVVGAAVVGAAVVGAAVVGAAMVVVGLVTEVLVDFGPAVPEGRPGLGADVGAVEPAALLPGGPAATEVVDALVGVAARGRLPSDS
jgi:hypothetical protein